LFQPATGREPPAIIFFTPDAPKESPMNSTFRIARRQLLALSVVLLSACAHAPPDPLASWRDGAAKDAIVQFVRKTTDQSSRQFVPPAERVATFDQDGTLWVEQPLYAQVMFALDRVKDVVKAQPALASEEPFKTVLSGDRAAMAKLTEADLLKIIGASQAGLTIDGFHTIVRLWAATAKHPKFQRPYTELVYAPMVEAMKYLRANGYRTYIVTGGGQEFVRAFAEAVYGVPPEQVIGTTFKVDYAMRDGVPMLINAPALTFVDDKGGKPVGINSVIGRRPQAAFGNSDGDQQMLEWATGDIGATLGMLVLHDDAQREYAYGPAAGLPASKVGTFTQPLYDQAKAKGWTVISMKNDWKRVFAFE
jgi:phosphoglycolate phosphatase-like HAD superfamily hydrolase